MSYMDINRSLTKDLRTLYSRSRWADIIGHRWSEIGKKYDLKDMVNNGRILELDTNSDLVLLVDKDNKLRS